MSSMDEQDLDDLNTLTRRRFLTSVTRRFSFEASHQLPWHAGKCAKLHGHSYQLDVTVSGPLSSDGIVIDFGDLKAVVTKHVLDKYDHAHLNDFLSNPTVELVAADIISRLLDAGLTVSKVTVRETASCSATVRVVGPTGD
ncbi:6-carboxytetrahydropterin synthase QueD [Rhodococcus sp. IEGM 1318]|uniref:6-carboxytetrahydropterin synthase QueD n=1 Tax=Rhodococcus sp. IEGM 1318 TaxID=3082226 RepID=UPI002953DB00|nr:6-carboxytetrahydropterin synthase QueD [Rhodococcus sp. IEGM 1318]MDV8008957.1 6-carboxytetrahydropterin synthase QueD [Rhodococcus sp. IEGM 1318]